MEPLVIIQSHYDIKPRSLPQVSEEFRLFHNLWLDPSGRQLVKVEDDGSEYVAAEIDDREVGIRTVLLRQFQAARQLDLLLFIDSVRTSASRSMEPPSRSAPPSRKLAVDGISATMARCHHRLPRSQRAGSRRRCG